MGTRKPNEPKERAGEPGIGGSKSNQNLIIDLTLCLFVFIKKRRAFARLLKNKLMSNATASDPAAA